MAKDDDSERRIYVLPKELLGRLRAYQSAQGIASEVEAARRLLDGALQMRDTVDDLLTKLKSRYADERDLRALNRDVLAAHPLISKIELDDTDLSFTMRSGDRGRIDTVGRIYKGDGSNDYFQEIDNRPKRPSTPGTPRAGGGGKPSWDSDKGGDLDEEIPF